MKVYINILDGQNPVMHLNEYLPESLDAKFNKTANPFDQATLCSIRHTLCHMVLNENIVPSQGEFIQTWNSNEGCDYLYQAQILSVAYEMEKGELAMSVDLAMCQLVKQEKETIFQENPV